MSANEDSRAKLQLVAEIIILPVLAEMKKYIK